MGKISVIIPTYNRGEFIKKTINSVLNQTIKNFELIIVDDGSTDNTKEIIEEFIKKDDRVKYFYQKNSGSPSEPRNLGIEKAQGEYIAFLDSDDEWLPEKLEKQLAHFKSLKDECAVVGCYAYVIEDHKKPYIEKRSDTNNIEDFLLKNDTFFYSSSSVFLKRELLNKYNIKYDSNLKIGEDLDFYISIAKIYINFSFVKEPLFNYFLHIGSISKHNKEHFYNYKKLLEKHFSFFKLNKKILSIQYRKLGTFALLADKRNEAFKYFFKSFKTKSNLRVLINMLIAFFGKNFYHKMLSLKNKYDINHNSNL